MERASFPRSLRRLYSLLPLVRPFLRKDARPVQRNHHAGSVEQVGSVQKALLQAPIMTHALRLTGRGFNLPVEVRLHSLLPLVRPFLRKDARLAHCNHRAGSVEQVGFVQKALLQAPIMTHALRLTGRGFSLTAEAQRPHSLLPLVRPFLRKDARLAHCKHPAGSVELVEFVLRALAKVLLMAHALRLLGRFRYLTAQAANSPPYVAYVKSGICVAGHTVICFVHTK